MMDEPTEAEKKAAQQAQLDRIKAEIEYIESNTIATSDPRTSRTIDPEKIQYYMDKTIEKLNLQKKVRVQVKYAGKYLEPRVTEVYDFKVLTHRHDITYHEAGIDVEQYVLEQSKEDFFWSLCLELVTELIKKKIIFRGMPKIYGKSFGDGKE